VSLTAWLLLAAAVSIVIAVVRKAGGRSPQSARQESGPFVTRLGKSVPADAAFFAWTGGDIDEMRAALSVQTNPIDRHHLLQELVHQTYRRRKEAAMAALCHSTAETYLAEFPTIFPVLVKDWKGETYHISVFQHFATLLTEQGDYIRAIQVCELALSKGLHDGTASGFEGRIQRIKKTAAKAA
jgi:hypothetical protein